MIAFPGGLAFLRPGWLLALALLPLLAFAWRRRARARTAWRAAVDAHLLPRLLEGGDGRRRSVLAGMAVLVGFALCILALAGPSWRSVPQPLQAGGGALVLALDLSSATLAGDLQPSRLAQARSRLDALLRAHAGEVALVVYADDAHVVSPMTVDPANVAVFLDALAPDIMPVDGQRPGRAIDLAVDLLEQAGHARGTILLLAPGSDVAGERAAARAAARGHVVSVLAMGTPEGAGYRGRDGGIARSALDMASLAALAAAGGGRVHAWDASPADVLATLDQGGATASDRARDGRVREDGGYWLLPVAMLLLLVAFRRGGVLAVLALCLLLPVPPPLAAQDGRRAAAEETTAPRVEAPRATLWRRADQAAHARSVDAEAAYRRGDFAAAARGFAGVPGPDAAYNRGNALARAGRYEEALAAYDEALRQAPGMADAIANRAAVEAAMQREPPPAGGARGGDSALEGGRQDGRPDAGGRGDDGEDADADPGRDPAGREDGPGTPPPAEEGDAAPQPRDAESDAGARSRQEAADRAQREAMDRALEAGDAGAGGEGGPDAQDAAGTAASTADSERERANAAWLRRVPDDPGALLRARFRNEHLLRRAGER